MSNPSAVVDVGIHDSPSARFHDSPNADSPSPPVVIASARPLNVKSEKELWRVIARTWHTAGLTDTPALFLEHLAIEGAKEHEWIRSPRVRAIGQRVQESWGRGRAIIEDNEDDVGDASFGTGVAIETG
ncbi:hypothetical protein PLICRDRAFT_702145 [Plicaturopsis crispa FD-325 SS-3]|uniref:Uncharacterized protein n=1 Tax=Plicaturopsis crispa FD-325 SS-3 TaxID=944288 RepID=A0A0C9SKR9_PLICR|nr:hypothetical protein PLICRDRAFT_702145 [Plicaturopsis crispa FD-325 SS-3]